MQPADLIELTAGDYRLVLEPARGGSVARFDWRGKPLFRPTCGPSILDTGCFPLVPFSNRIAQGAFRFGGNEVRIAPNFPGGGHPHPLHGFGWLASWQVTGQGEHGATLSHTHAAGEWPWTYAASQRFELTPDGLLHSLSVTNCSAQPMPAGLGLHPYFPRTATTLYRSLHRGEWLTAPDGLPQQLDLRDAAIDWWDGQPAASRTVDTVYMERSGPLRVVWPDRDMALTMAPCGTLGCTVVYTPADADFFCVEPVTHATDAVNRPERPGPMALLGVGEVLSVAVRYRADIA